MVYSQEIASEELVHRVIALFYLPEPFAEHASP